MDPLTALSLAGTGVQFVDFSSKLISQGYELYSSTNGQLAAHEELELMTSDLRNVILRIQNTNAMGYSESSPVRTDRGYLNPPTSGALKRICEEAIEFAQEILTKLGGLKLDLKLQTSKFETFQLRTVVVDEEGEG